MTETPSPASRIDALEVRISYLDETIETLNNTITAQWKQIDALSREMLNLRERLEDAESKSSGLPANERPPHY